MSKNVLVIPKRYSISKTFYKSHGLDFDRADYDKYEELDKVVLPLPHNHGIDIGKEDGSEVIDDCYGDLIRCVTVDTFIKIYDTDDFTEWDKACMAFLKALDPDTLCALYYH